MEDATTAAETTSKINSLEEVAVFLKKCRQRHYPPLGLIVFEPHGLQEDLTSEILTYLQGHPEHQITMTKNFGFIGISEPNLDRMNGQLQPSDAVKVNVKTAVNMSLKYGR